MKKNPRFHIAYSINSKNEILEYTSPFPTKGQAMSFLKKNQTCLATHYLKSTRYFSMHTKSFPGTVKEIIKSFEYRKFVGDIGDDCWYKN